MKYKGFIIQAVPLFDYKPDPKSRSGQYKAVKVGVEYYEVLDPMDNNNRYFAEDTIALCKSEIDRILQVLGLKDNSKKSWDALDTMYD